MTVSECVWADWRGLIECEINKVSHSALQRPLNDLYENDHQRFDGFVLGIKVLFAFGLGVSSLSLSLSVSLFIHLSVFLLTYFLSNILEHQSYNLFSIYSSVTITVFLFVYNSKVKLMELEIQIATTLSVKQTGSMCLPYFSLIYYSFIFF